MIFWCRVPETPSLVGDRVMGETARRKHVLNARCDAKCRGKVKAKWVEGKSDAELLDLIFMLLVFNFDLSPFTFFPVTDFMRAET
jgi:hypothetical protein